MNTTEAYRVHYRPSRWFRLRAWLTLWKYAFRADWRHPIRARREITAISDEMRRVISRQLMFGPDA